MYDNFNNEQNQNNENVQKEQNTTANQNQQYSQYNQNGYSYNGQNGYYNYNNMNEYSYNPKPKKPKHRKLLIALVVCICVVAVGATSVVGYSIMTGNTLGNLFNRGEGSSIRPDVSDNNTTTNKVKRENLPTLIQLATPDDAMKIPEIVEKVSPSVVGISCLTNSGTVTGTGIVMSEDGYIITNAHVVDGASAISVVLPSEYTDGEKDDEDNSYKAELIGKDNQTDIAVVKIEKDGLVAVEFGTSAEVQVGEVSIVIGNPLGLDLANSVTAGIISAMLSNFFYYLIDFFFSNNQRRYQTNYITCSAVNDYVLFQAAFHDGFAFFNKFHPQNQTTTANFFYLIRIFCS